VCAKEAEDSMQRGVLNSLTGCVTKRRLSNDSTPVIECLFRGTCCITTQIRDLSTDLRSDPHRRTILTLRWGHQKFMSWKSQNHGPRERGSLLLRMMLYYACKAVKI